jgi:hypothetical protein
MSTEFFTRVALRLFAIWMLVPAVTALASVARLYATGIGYVGAAGLTLLSVAMQVAVAVVIWKNTSWLAQRIGGSGSDPEPANVTISGDPLTRGLVGVLGVFMLSSAVPESLFLLVAFIASRILGPSPLAGQPAYDAQMGLYTVGGVANAASVFIRVVAGYFLISNTQFVSAVLLREGQLEQEPRRPTNG